MKGRDILRNLAEIGLPEPAIERVVAILADFASLISEEATLCVTDAYDEDQTRRFFNLWFFDQNLMFESKNFLISSNIDIINMEDINYLEVHKEAIGAPYDLHTNASKFKISLTYRSAPCLIKSSRPRPSATCCSPRRSPPRQRRPGGCCSNSRASAPSWPPASGWRRYFATSTIAASSRLTLGWRRHPGKAAQSITSRAFPKPGTRDYEPP